MESGQCQRRAADSYHSILAHIYTLRARESHAETCEMPVLQIFEHKESESLLSLAQPDIQSVSRKHPKKLGATRQVTRTYQTIKRHQIGCRLNGIYLT